MAIKAVSQLDKFENGVDSTTIALGQNLAYFADGYLTNRDKNMQSPLAGKNASGVSMVDYDVGRTQYTKNINSDQVINTSSYWSALFELSKPDQASKSITNDLADYYTSQHTTYEAILKNILWDTKSYLNYRNNLNDYNLCAIVEGDQVFKGTKYLNGTLCATNITAQNMSAYTLSAQQISANCLTAISSNLSDVIINNLCVTTKFIAGTDITYEGNKKVLAFDGWALGLLQYDSSTGKAYRDNNSTVKKLNCGSYLSVHAVESDNQDNLLTNTSLSGKLERQGDPVCFKDGKPYALTCVNCANTAYNLTDSSGNKWNVGTAGTISSPFTPSCTVVKFVNGTPVSCNEIDYAHHAFWSDLGERYLADKEYEPGTLVKFGGEKEITAADDEVNAIVSTKAFDLNAALSGGTVIALCGRVPTKVIGKIKKFDKVMLSDIPGVACRWDGKSRVIGRALESNKDDGIKLVECVTKFEL